MAKRKNGFKSKFKEERVCKCGAKFIIDPRFEDFRSCPPCRQAISSAVQTRKFSNDIK